MADESASKLKEQVEALRRRVAELENAPFTHGQLERRLRAGNELYRMLVSVILGYGNLPAPSDFPLAERDSLLRAIERSSESLLALMGDFLEFSKVEAATATVVKSDCCPYRILDEVVSGVRTQVLEQGLSLTVEYTLPLPKTIRSDGSRLRQILTTLITGTVECTRRGSVCVTVRCVVHDGLLRMQFEIADTGVDLTPEEKATLFEPFHRSDAVTSRRFAGMELRLYVSKRLAEMLGGGIEVENRPDKGCTLTLTVDPGPVAGVDMLRCPPTFAPREPQSARSGAAVLQGTVLLAEDDRNLQGLVKLVLSKAGLTVETAENGREACQKASASAVEGKPYDLILMDIQMPELDGLEATRQLRGDGWTGPIVALTAHVLLADRQKCLDAGCDDYLPKPVDWTSLLDTVGNHLGQGTVPVAPVEPRSPDANSAPLGSGLIDDATMSDLLDAFAAELPGRACRIEAALEERDFDSLSHFSHQLKGAAAVYGLNRIALAADRVHKLAGPGGEHEQLPAAVSRLVQLCGQTR